MKIEEIDALVRAACPAHGVSAKGEVWFKDEATEEQRAAARKIMEENLLYLEPTVVL